MLGLTPVFHPDAPQTLARFSRRAGLPLTAAQAESLLAHQEQTLLNLGRVDFSGGIVLAEDWADTLAQLTELFYAFKFETRDALADDALLAAMRKRFDGACGGSLEALADCRAEDLFCAAQEGGRP